MIRIRQCVRQQEQERQMVPGARGPSEGSLNERQEEAEEAIESELLEA